MEDCVVINFLNPTPVAKLILAIDSMGTLAHYQNPSELIGLVLIWPLVSDILAGVKEQTLAEPVAPMSPFLVLTILYSDLNLA